MTKQVNIRLPADIIEKIQTIAAANNMTVSKFVADAIALKIAVKDNMNDGTSRLVIEHPKNAPNEHYKLLINT